MSLTLSWHYIQFFWTFWNHLGCLEHLSKGSRKRTTQWQYKCWSPLKNGKTLPLHVDTGLMSGQQTNWHWLPKSYEIGIQYWTDVHLCAGPTLVQHWQILWVAPSASSCQINVIHQYSWSGNQEWCSHSSTFGHHLRNCISYGDKVGKFNEVICVTQGKTHRW